jgi:hypothetical protein
MKRLSSRRFEETTMATVTVQDMTILSSGLTPSYAAGDAAETYLIPNNGDMFVHVKKSGAGSCTVTVATPNELWLKLLSLCTTPGGWLPSGANYTDNKTAAVAAITTTSRTTARSA